MGEFDDLKEKAQGLEGDADAARQSERQRVENDLKEGEEKVGQGRDEAESLEKKL